MCWSSQARKAEMVARLQEAMLTQRETQQTIGDIKKLGAAAAEKESAAAAVISETERVKVQFSALTFDL